MVYLDQTAYLFILKLFSHRYAKLGIFENVLHGFSWPQRFMAKIENRSNNRCPSLSCPLDSLPPRGQANRGWLTPRGASCPGISCPPPWLSSPPGGKLSRPVYLAPRPTQVKICTCYFVIFLYHFNEFSISHKVRKWCLWG